MCTFRKRLCPSFQLLVWVLWGWGKTIESSDDLVLGFVAALLRFSSSLGWGILRPDQNQLFSKAWELRPSDSRGKHGGCLSSYGLLIAIWVSGVFCVLSEPQCLPFVNCCLYSLKAWCASDILPEFSSRLQWTSFLAHSGYQSIGKKVAMNTFSPREGLS